MKNKTAIVALAISIIIVSSLFIALRTASSQTASPQTSLIIQPNGTAANPSCYLKPDCLIQTDGSGLYEAVNATNGQVISSSTDASSIINSEITDNICIGFGTGTFFLSSAITKQADNVTIEGQGGKTLFQVASATNINAFDLNDVHGWIIANLTIGGDGGSQNLSSGISFTNSEGIFVDGCSISDTCSNAISFISSRNCTADNNVIFNSLRAFGIFVWNTSYSSVTDNTVDFTYYSGITVSNGANYNLIKGNVVSRSGQMGSLGDGIEIGSTPQSGGTVGNIVSNNTCHDCVMDGISVAQSNFTVVSGNSVFNNDVQGISIESNDTGTLVTGNSVFNNSALSSVGAGGIIVLGASTSATTISSNTVYGNWQNGVFLIQGATGTVVLNNTVYNNNQKAADACDGILVATSNCLIQNNRCFDDQSVKTQIYGVYEEGGYTNNTFIGNAVSK